MFQDRCTEITRKVQELVRKGNDLYKLNLPMPRVRFDLRGRSAGQAYRKMGEYGVRFNRDMIMNSGWDHLINDTVPHEVAHLFGFYTEQDRGHGRVWYSICRALGGSGQRCHSEEVTYANGKTYYYTTSTGHVVTFSSNRHSKIQRGTSYRFRDGRGIVDRNCAYSTTQPTKQQPQQTVRSLPQQTVPSARGQQRNGATTKSHIVRQMIARAKALGTPVATVIDCVVRELGMSRSMASRYVKGNWDKA